MLEIQQKDIMKNYIELIRQCNLFADIKPDDLLNLLTCINATIKTYTKNQIIQNENTCSKKGGILLSGALQTFYYDYYGNRNIIGQLEPLQIFSVAQVFTNTPSRINIAAIEDSVILEFYPEKIASPCSNYCQFHIILIKNLLKIMATKNIELNKKIKCISKRTTKEKLMDYLHSESQKQNSKVFYIPYDRQALADYLCVERSAMAAEISKLRKEKVIDCKKNKFKIL